MATNGQAPPPFNPAALFEHPAFKTMQRAQQQMAEQWSKTLGSVSPDVMRDLSDHWQQALQRSLSVWSEHTAPIAKQTAERGAERAKTLAGVTTGLARAWQTLARDLGDGTNWMGAATRFSEAVRSQVETATTAAMEAAQDGQTVMQRFLGELQAPDAPWAAAPTLPFGSLSKWARAEGVEEDEVPVVALFEHIYETFDRSFGQLLNSPGLGLTREFNEDLAQAVAAYQDYLREQARYQTHMGSLFTQAVERFTGELAERAQAGEPVGNLRDLTRLWTAEADAVFTDAFREPDYIEQQNRLVAATMHYRQRRRVVAEMFQRLNDQPTRSEVDEAFKLLHASRKQIKALRREVDRLKAQIGNGAPATPKPATPKPAAVTPEASEPDDLTEINGIGKVRGQQLAAAGYATFADLAAASPAALADVIGSRLFDEERLAQVIADAKTLA